MRFRIMLVLHKLWGVLKWISSDTEDSVFFSMILSAVSLGMGLMVLEELKNLIIVSSGLDAMGLMYAPLLGITYNLPTLWDLGLLLIIMSFCFAVTMAYKLGKLKGVK